MTGSYEDPRTSKMVSPIRKGYLRGVCNIDTRAQCLKGVLLFLTVWMSGMCFGFFYQGSTGLFDITPLRKLALGDFGAQNSTKQLSVVLPIGGAENSKDKNESTVALVTPSPKNPQGCQFPVLDPVDPAIKHLIKKLPPVDCSKGVPNLVYLEDDTLKINKTKIPLALKNKNEKFKECKQKIHTKKPGSDSQLVVTWTSPPFNVSMKINKTDEHFFAECYNSTGQVISRSYFSVIRPKPKLEALLKENYEKHLALNNPKETLSVLILGIDGMSKQNFQRAMPKTRGFLLDVLNATELHKYNKLGLNTFPNVMGLLTGKHSKSYLNDRWSWKKTFDAINDAFIWTDFHRAGYRTGMMLDRSYITSFHYQKKGWNKNPVDYYLRPMPVAFEKDKLMSKKGFDCVGDIPEITLYHNYWVQMASTFNNTPTKPYFGYSFAARLTHDDHNKASKGDHLYYNFLKELHDKKVLNNTVIIWFSDHGERFGAIRNTYNGLIEARTPYLFLVFPPWFHKKYPHLMKVLKINQERLASHFDVYETMRDLLYFKAETGKGDINQRGISLFKEIPIERTCQHVEIPTEFCVCNNITKTEVSEKKSQELGSGLLRKVISSTANLRDKCVELKLKSVNSILSMTSDSYLKQAKKVEGEMYQLSIVTEPGEAMYEGTVHYSNKPDVKTNSSSTVTVIGEVVRLNFYKGQAECIEDPILRQFCYCKNLKA